MSEVNCKCIFGKEIFNMNSKIPDELKNKFPNGA